MHKNTKLLPRTRAEIFRRWGLGAPVAGLAREYKVSRQTIYGTVKDARLGVFANRSSMNHRYRSVLYGLRKLERTEARTSKRLLDRERRARRYERSVPGELVHLDTKRLPLLRGEAALGPREYLFVAIDDHSRWLFADIFPDKTSYSAAIFLEETRRAVPFLITGIYSDNGSEYKGRSDHPVSLWCTENGASHAFTKVKHPWTNGKAERVIRTLMEEWHPKSRNLFQSRIMRRKHLLSYCDWYNQVRPHQSLDGKTPLERLEAYLESVNNALT
jgi:transposase InsO family protein